jgi:glutaminyl-tRNA synthetase
MAETESSPPTDFIREIVAADQAAGKHGGQVVTRFPPEPNGYLHIGHAKAFCLDFAIAEENGGRCNLRFDDTDPEKEEVEYIEAIKEDIRWLGFDWGDRELFASDYFEELYGFAVKLIGSGHAYVDSLSAEEVRKYRGTLTEPGRNSPDRERRVEESLDLFARMRAGEFEEGAYVLRAKIDMASPNMNLRDPAMYRIKRATHPRTGDAWCIYPMYDWAHGQSDAIEGVTHSLCSLEFELHRPLYDWFLDRLGFVPDERPRQIEFARMNVSHTITSKRKLRRLVEDGHVGGWDDPRMPTLLGLRRRGYTPASIRRFIERAGMAKRDNIIELALLEHLLREDLNRHAPRRFGVLDPLKLVIDNYPQGQVDEFDAINNPEDESAGTRTVPFSRELWIERNDFMEDPPRKFFRMAPGREVRLRYAYLVTCTDVVKDDAGEVVEVHCTYDPETRGGSAPDGRRVKGTIHWVSAPHALEAEVRLYDTLFTEANPDAGDDFCDHLNPDSLEVRPRCFLEPALGEARPGDRFQFERLGYFCVDTVDSTAEHAVFNRTVGLRDSWAKMQKQSQKQKKGKSPG